MQRLTKGEIEVMKVLWEHGEMKPAELQAHFPREIKNSALRSYLTILTGKGHLIRERRGKTYYYRARTRSEPALRKMIGDFINTVFGGSADALLCRLIRHQNLSEKELLRLKKMADGDEE